MKKEKTVPSLTAQLNPLVTRLRISKGLTRSSSDSCFPKKASARRSFLIIAHSTIFIFEIVAEIPLVSQRSVIFDSISSN